MLKDKAIGWQYQNRYIYEKRFTNYYPDAYSYLLCVTLVCIIFNFKKGKKMFTKKEEVIKKMSYDFVLNDFHKHLISKVLDIINCPFCGGHKKGQPKIVIVKGETQFEPDLIVEKCVHCNSTISKRLKNGTDNKK